MKKICMMITVISVVLAGINALQAEPKEKIFAKVGKEEITQSSVDRFIQELPPQYKAQINAQMASPEAKKQVIKNIVENIIAKKLFSREARRLKLHQKPEVKHKIDNVIDQILVSEYINQIRDQIKIKKDEMEAYYEKNKDQYQEPEQVKVRHILLETEEDARVVLTELKGLKGGKDFAQLAEEKSICPSKTKGGDLGWFDRGRMVPAFETAAFNLNKDEISEIVKTKFGYHIIKLEDRKAAKQKSFDSVKDQIEMQLKQEKMDTEIKKIQAKLEKEFKVKRFEDALK